MWPFPKTRQAGFFERRWLRWVNRRHPQGARPHLLTQNRVYIFLSRTGLLFGAVTLAMLGGAMNYDLALAYLLVFLLASMALVSMFHTFRNLLGLSVSAGRTEGCFAGESARFEVLLDNPSRHARYNVNMYCDEGHASCDIGAGDMAKVWLTVSAPSRGWLRMPRVRIVTHWPIGVFRAWSYARFAQRALIYPKPEADTPTLPFAMGNEGEGHADMRGHDDFAGLRPFQRGDSPRHIAWKAAARGTSLPVKEFHGEQALSLWFDWNDLPAHMDVEARLSRLTAWVLHAHRADVAYGLDLAGQRIAAASGDGHRDACLAALSLFGLRQVAGGEDERDG